MTQAIKKTHFIGIGGIGMSALAQILLDQKMEVSGSDLSITEITEQLRQKGATISQNHCADHILPGDRVVFSSQIQENNPEYLAALSLKCPLIHRSELLADMMKGCRGLAIAGTHGKTTTSSLLTALLIEGGYDPTFALGGICNGLNGKYGKGDFFIIEADESDGSFLNYHPHGAIITNIDSEHLDYYQTLENLHTAFQKFISQITNKELFFYCGDDPYLPALAHQKGISYGFGANNDLRITDYQQTDWSTTFNLSFEGKIYRALNVSLIGEHNALNAAAVFGLSLKLGLTEECIRETFNHFPGVKRRCEKRAEVNSILFLDDYAHHPTEISTTLKGVKQAIQERRLVVVFEPHRYSRVRDLMSDFGQAFEWADYLIVTDIYSAFETPIAHVNTKTLLQAIQQVISIPSYYVPRTDLVSHLSSMLCAHDVVLTLGAGKITYLHNELLAQFKFKKLKVGLIFGGQSYEHEISLRSARFVAQSLNRNLYDVRFFGIDKGGQWIVGQEAEHLLDSKEIIESSQATNLLSPTVTYELEMCDLYLPILHGTRGEDGTIQGFFEMLNKPYVGPDYRSAAICMDKILTKRIAAKEGILTPRDLTFGYRRWKEEPEKILNEILDQFPMPLYVKPVHLGSSIGITPVFEPEKLKEAITVAFRYDTQVMVEEGKVGCRELEFAVMGNTGSFAIAVPGPGEKLAAGDFVDYEKKYGTNAVQTTLHPDLSSDIIEKGKQLAQKAYEAIGCTGMTRVDFLLDPHGQFWLFEMNSIPGLTQLSLFPKIWNRDGLNCDRLIDRLIILSLARHRQYKQHSAISLKCL